MLNLARFTGQVVVITGASRGIGRGIVGSNHDVIDGAPAARFIRRLLELIESGYGFVRASLTDEWRPG